MKIEEDLDLDIIYAISQVQIKLATGLDPAEAELKPIAVAIFEDRLHRWPSGVRVIWSDGQEE